MKVTNTIILSIILLALLFSLTLAEEVTIENESSSGSGHDSSSHVASSSSSSSSSSPPSTKQEEKPVYRYDPWTLATDLFKASERYFDSIWDELWHDDFVHYVPSAPSRSALTHRRPSTGSSHLSPFSRNSGFNSLSYAQEIPTDVKRLKDRFVVESSAPGYSKDELQISLEPSRQVPGRNILTIRGEKKSQEHTEDKKQHHYMIRERNSSFSRSFAFDSDIDRDSIVAKYDDGILKIELPTKESPKEKVHRISIE